MLRRILDSHHNLHEGTGVVASLPQCLEQHRATIEDGWMNGLISWWINGFLKTLCVWPLYSEIPDTSERQNKNVLDGMER